MNRRSPTTDDGGESSLDIGSANAKSDYRIESLKPHPLEGTERTPKTSLHWNQPNGQNGLLSHAVGRETLSPLSLLVPSSDMVVTKDTTADIAMRRKRGPWSGSFLTLFTATVGVVVLLAILRSLVTRQIESKGCQMSYMRPSYIHFGEFDTEHTRFATKYSLYLYREQGIDDDSQLNGIPVLFIPGNAGSYKQVRPIAAEAANYFQDHLQHDATSVESGIRHLDFFTVDFNEDITAFHGQTLLDQAEYLNEAVRYILSLYSEPHRTSREPHLPDPSSVVILGHSMGGVVARAMLIQSNYQANSINTIITMSAPHARPPVTFDGRIVQIYDEINDYWRRAYTQKWASNNPLWHVTLVSIAGGNLDTVVPSDYTSIESLVPGTHGFTVFTTGIPFVWTSMDHQAILWCDQFRKVVSQTLFDIVDVHRASQTKPRAERMRIFKKRFLTGMEAVVEKTVSLNDPTTLLTIDDESSVIIPTGGRLVIPDLGSPVKPKAYLLPIPPQRILEPTRFTFLTDIQLERTDEKGHFMVLICSVLPPQSNAANIVFTSTINLSGNNSAATRLTCRNAVNDVVILPASTMETHHPFNLQSSQEMRTFSYLQYDLEYLTDHQFVAVVDRARVTNLGFVFAEFSNQSDFQKRRDIDLIEILTVGLSMRLPAQRPFAIEVDVPSLKSGLIAYQLHVKTHGCRKNSLLMPLVRQHLQKPYESKYFVNVQHADISFHGAAPYVPPPLEHNSDDGFAFGIWSDPTCESPIDIELHVDVFGSMGKLYMRYRTVFAAFPLLIVALVLRKQFSLYDETGDFISFSEGLDLSLRQSIPLLLLFLTVLTVSLGGITKVWLGDLVNRANSGLSFSIDFHRNDLLTGTDDPFFMILVPLIGLVCTGVCAVLHYVMIGLTQALGVLYGFVSGTFTTCSDSAHARAQSPAFVPSTPRRRMISTAILLFLVSTFIPYQFAYLVACLVQLFTVVRALRVYSMAGLSPQVSPNSISNYYHYSHSILLLMMWVLPINLPILAVWIRNLAVHWLTPFSSHHNVLSIMPFILLVENLTTGRMIPQVHGRLRHVTSGLLFGTALSAAIFGVSHAYSLHYIVNVVVAWLVVLHSSSESWSLTSLGAMFDGNADEVRNEKTT